MESIRELCRQEEKRQSETISLIASENYAPSEVLSLMGSALTNKYAEGYPGHRYYAGCAIIDAIEQQAIEYGKKAFGAEHFNVQPHSGSNANLAAYLSCLKPGDTILGMSLAAGGHLTHGHPINFSGILFNFIPYGVSQESEQIDYDALQSLALQHRPRMIMIGASAYSRVIDYEQCAHIAQSCGALLCIDIAHIAGLVAAGIHPSPTPYADIVTGTTHKTLRGPRGGFIYGKKELAKALDKAVMPGIQGGPLMNVIAAKGECFAQAVTQSFKLYQELVVHNAQIMSSTFTELGYRIVGGGTDTHLFLIDLQKKSSANSLTPSHLTGKQAEKILEECGIVVNRNLIPFDLLPPHHASGIRIGTPAITTRGFKKKEVIQVVHWIDEALRYSNDKNRHRRIKNEVLELCHHLPIPSYSV